MLPKLPAACLALVAALAVLVPLAEVAEAQPPAIPRDGTFTKCYCVDNEGGHAWVTFIDGATGQSYSRGFYAGGYGNDQDAPDVPPAGTPGPADSHTSPGTGGSSAASGSSGTSGSASNSAGGSGSSQHGGSSASTGGSLRDSGGLADVLDGKGTVQDDSGKTGTCLCLNVSAEDYDKSVDAVKSWERRYRLLSQNCMDFVAYVAAAEGTELPRYDWWGWGPSQPSTFLESLKALRAEGNASVRNITRGGLDEHRVSMAPAGEAGAEEAPDVGYGYAEDLLREPRALVAALQARDPVPPVAMGEPLRARAGELLALRAGEDVAAPPLAAGERALVVWDMGDGATLTGTYAPGHAYAAPGTYEARLTVVKEGSPVGLWVGTVPVVVEAPMAAPRLEVTPQPGKARAPVILTLRDAQGALLEERTIEGNADVRAAFPPGAYQVVLATRLNIAGVEGGRIDVGTFAFEVAEPTTVSLGVASAGGAAQALRGGAGFGAAVGFGGLVGLASVPGLRHLAPQALAARPRLPWVVGAAAAAVAFAPVAFGLAF